MKVNIFSDFRIAFTDQNLTLIVFCQDYFMKSVYQTYSQTNTQSCAHPNVPNAKHASIRQIH